MTASRERSAESARHAAVGFEKLSRARGYARGGGAGGLIDRDARRSLPAIGTRSCPVVGCLLSGGRYAPAVKHWLAQPASVRHCGRDPQSFIALWHGQSVGLAAFISAVIVHGFAMATLATGAKAEARESNKMISARNVVMASRAFLFFILGLGPESSSKPVGLR